MEWSVLFNTFIGIISILNPIGNMPIFLGYVDNEEPKVQRTVAILMALSIFILLTTFFLFGTRILNMFGIYADQKTIEEIEKLKVKIKEAEEKKGSSIDDSIKEKEAETLSEKTASEIAKCFKENTKTDVKDVEQQIRKLIDTMPKDAAALLLANLTSEVLTSYHNDKENDNLEKSEGKEEL